MGDKVEFEHKVFSSFEDPYFRQSSQGSEAVLVVDMGGTEITLTLAGIQNEFKISDASPDGKMLRLISDALGFVKMLKPGDPLPKEVLTGEPSWEVSARHTEISTQRLNMQLVTWLSGGETLITDPEALLQIAEDPKTKEKVNTAFTEAAQQLGFGDDRQKVVGLIEMLAKELAHIEALRDMYARVREIDEKIQTLRKIYAHERSVFDVADRVARLMKLAVDGFEDTFSQTDANTGEVIAVLKNIDAQVLYIRKARDHLYRQLMAWEETFEMWQNQEAQRSPKTPEILREIYRFLAPRYMPVDDWKLYTKLSVDREETKSTMTW